ncbi:hypothetical protein D9M70_450410 [compost metagenome]
MAHSSRFSRIEIGMSFNDVKQIFGKDIWQHAGFDKRIWLVNNETDKSSSRGYQITFDENMKVKSKGMFSCS